MSWGFKGLVIHDYKTDNIFMDSRQMLYAGNDLILTSTTIIVADIVIALGLTTWGFFAIFVIFAIRYFLTRRKLNKKEEAQK